MRRWCLIALMLCVVSPASAETTTYGYDVFGRLVGTGHTTGPMDGFRSEINLDAADNRASVNSSDIRMVLLAGQSKYSADGRFRLTMQTDGNLVLYMGATALWHTNTYGSAADRAVMQSDGNLVVYTPSYVPLWASYTAISAGAYLALQDDGNLVIWDVGRRPIWASNTGGH